MVQPTSHEGWLRPILERMPHRLHHTEGSHTPPGGVKLKWYSEISRNQKKKKKYDKHRVARKRRQCYKQRKRALLPCLLTLYWNIWNTASTFNNSWKLTISPARCFHKSLLTFKAFKNKRLVPPLICREQPTMKRLKIWHCGALVLLNFYRKFAVGRQQTTSVSQTWVNTRSI